MAASVLIIEDDTRVQRMYRELFRLENFKVEVADDGVEGLEKVQSKKPDVILLDVMMPRMDGLTVLKELKRNTTTKDIPVILLSNLDDKASIKKALTLGATDYLLKSAQDPLQLTKFVQSKVPL